jgi:hypothetical protein
MGGAAQYPPVAKPNVCASTSQTAAATVSVVAEGPEP